MRSLAKVVKVILGKPNVELVSMPPDSMIQYRHVSKPDADIQLAKDVMTDEILELAS